MKTLGTLIVGSVIGYFGCITIQLYLNEEGLKTYLVDTLEKL